ncbi:uracil phosphoribosyltransferase-domain-containing protein [Xylariaceae sp. FL0016]|nr:uracil phosphoribosyltransferase-domain-containing protein [Xylariaceae sp. FL0016]
MPDPSSHIEPRTLMSQTARSNVEKRPVVIGLYGLPGSGKTFLMNQLKQDDRIYEVGSLKFYEGSQVIDAMVPGGLNKFKRMTEIASAEWRKLAIQKIKQECLADNAVGLVVEHFMFWDEGEKTGHEVYTQADLETYTHILYLDTPSDVIAQRRLNDRERERSVVAIEHLNNWKKTEKGTLRHLCRDHRIIFMAVRPQPSRPWYIPWVIRTLLGYAESHSRGNRESTLESIIAANLGKVPRTALVIDADRPLGPDDKLQPLKTLFSSPFGYSRAAFLQAMLLYEDTIEEAEYDAICDDIASTMTIYDPFDRILRKAAELEGVVPIVVTCGLQRVWEKVIEKKSLSDSVKVVGGGRLTSEILVTPELKADLVCSFRTLHGLYVWAFGDSPLDIPMLVCADQAIVVVGDDITRSKTMDSALEHAFEKFDARPRQALMAEGCSQRLTFDKVPRFHFDDPNLNHMLAPSAAFIRHPRVEHATDQATTKLPMTRMRDANISGPVLREAHRLTGLHLAMGALAGKIGVEGYPVSHVVGGLTEGYRLKNEKKTTIVAAMRGEEPMALGINEAFPTAMFVHAYRPEDIGREHIAQQSAIILVDSVVNTGATIVQFVKRVREVSDSARVVVVAGVVQAKAVTGGDFAQLLDTDSELSLITLRLSDNQFTGSGTTDTGNRLFNTTHLQ